MTHRNDPPPCFIPFLRTDSNYQRDTRETALICKDKTLAQQQFKDQCDINILHARYLETGEIPQVEEGLTYGNFTGIFDFQTAMNAVRTAEGLFQQFPARIKNRFDNDPQKLLEFLRNDENREEAEFLGIVQKPLPPEATNESRSEGIPRETTQDRKEPRRTPRGKTETEPAKGPGSETPQDD